MVRVLRTEKTMFQSLIAQTLVAPLHFPILAILLCGGCGKTPPQCAALLHIGQQENTTNEPVEHVAFEYEHFRNIQAATLKFPTVLRAALKQPGIADLPLVKQQQAPQKWLEEHLRVVCPEKTEVVQIELPNEDAAQAAKIINAVVATYMENIVADRDAKLKRLDHIEKQYEEAAADFVKAQSQYVMQRHREISKPELRQPQLRALPEPLKWMKNHAEDLAEELEELKHELAKPPRVTVQQLAIAP